MECMPQSKTFGLCQRKIVNCKSYSSALQYSLKVFYFCSLSFWLHVTQLHFKQTISIILFCSPTDFPLKYKLFNLFLIALSLPYSELFQTHTHTHTASKLFDIIVFLPLNASACSIVTLSMSRVESVYYCFITKSSNLQAFSGKHLPLLR